MKPIQRIPSTKRVLAVALFIIIVGIFTWFFFIGANCSGFLGGSSWDVSPWITDIEESENGTYTVEGYVEISGTGRPYISNLSIRFNDRSGDEFATVPVNQPLGIGHSYTYNFSTTVTKLPHRLELEPVRVRQFENVSTKYTVYGLKINGIGDYKPYVQYSDRYC